MAFAQTHRLPVRHTVSERVALDLARGLERIVAWRMERRSERLTRYVAQREAQLHLRTVIDEAMVRARLQQLR